MRESSLITRSKQTRLTLPRTSVANPRRGDAPGISNVPARRGTQTRSRRSGVRYAGFRLSDSPKLRRRAGRGVGYAAAAPLAPKVARTSLPSPARSAFLGLRRSLLRAGGVGAAVALRGWGFRPADVPCRRPGGFVPRILRGRPRATRAPVGFAGYLLPVFLILPPEKRE